MFLRATRRRPAAIEAITHGRRQMAQRGPMFFTARLHSSRSQVPARSDSVAFSTKDGAPTAGESYGVNAWGTRTLSRQPIVELNAAEANEPAVSLLGNHGNR
jgi:hypothetical protein